MEIRIGVCWCIVVDHDVDSLNVDTTPKDISSDQYTFLKILELLIARNTRTYVSNQWTGVRRELTVLPDSTQSAR